MQIDAVGTSENPVVLQNSGDVKENLYYISIQTKSGATAEEITAAKKEAYDSATGVFTFTSGAKVTRNSRNYTDKHENPQSIVPGLPIFLTNPVSYHMEDGSDTYVVAGQVTAVFYVPQSVLDNCQ